MTTGLYLDRLELPKARINREPYIVAISVNGAGAANGRREVEIRTKPAEGIDKDKPLDFDPPLELFPPSYHGGVLVSKIIVMESDDGSRRLGDRLARIAGISDRLKGTSLGRRLAQGAAVATAGIASAGLAEIAPIVIERLRRAGDDLLGEIDVVLSEDLREGTFWTQQSASGKVRLTLRVAASAEAEAEEWAPDVDVILHAQDGREISGDEEVAGPTPSVDLEGDSHEIGVGDLVNWESNGALVLPEPKKIVRFEQPEGEGLEGIFAFVEGSETGIPAEELVLVSKADEEEFENPTRWAQVRAGLPCLAVVPGAGGSLYRGVVTAVGDGWAGIEFPDWDHDENVPGTLRVERLKDILIPREADEGA